jgi:hypothetical protein
MSRFIGSRAFANRQGLSFVVCCLLEILAKLCGLIPSFIYGCVRLKSKYGYFFNHRQLTTNNSHSLYGQFDDKFCALGGVIMNADQTVVICDNSVDNRKTQPHAAFFG